MKKVAKILIKSLSIIFLVAIALIILLIIGVFANNYYYEHFSTAAKIKKYVKTNDIEKLKKLKLNKGINAYYNHKTPLLYAVEGNNVEAVKYFIGQGADLNMPPFSYRSSGKFIIDPPSGDVYIPLLSKAIDTKNIEIVKILIENGADVNEEWYRRTYHQGDAEIVAKAISNGSVLGIKEHLTRKPLSYAKEKGNTEIINLLIANGAKE